MRNPPLHLFLTFSIIGIFYKTNYENKFSSLITGLKGITTQMRVFHYNDQTKSLFRESLLIHKLWILRAGSLV